MAKPARQLTKAISDWLTLNRWHVQKGGSTASMNARGQFYRTGEKGAPDLQAHRKRRVLVSSPSAKWPKSELEYQPAVDWLCIEVKAGKDKLRDDQASWLGKAKSCGAICIVARDVSDVIKLVEGL